MPSIREIVLQSDSKEKIAQQFFTSIKVAIQNNNNYSLVQTLIESWEKEPTFSLAWVSYLYHAMKYLSQKERDQLKSIKIALKGKTFDFYWLYEHYESLKNENSVQQKKILFFKDQMALELTRCKYKKGISDSNNEAIHVLYLKLLQESSLQKLSEAITDAIFLVSDKEVRHSLWVMRQNVQRLIQVPSERDASETYFIRKYMNVEVAYIKEKKKEAQGIDYPNFEQNDHAAFQQQITTFTKSLLESSRNQDRDLLLRQSSKRQAIFFASKGICADPKAKFSDLLSLLPLLSPVDQLTQKIREKLKKIYHEPTVSAEDRLQFLDHLIQEEKRCKTLDEFITPQLVRLYVKRPDLFFQRNHIETSITNVIKDRNQSIKSRTSWWKQLFNWWLKKDPQLIETEGFKSFPEQLPENHTIRKAVKTLDSAELKTKLDAERALESVNKKLCEDFSRELANTRLNLPVLTSQEQLSNQTVLEQIRVIETWLANLEQDRDLYHAKVQPIIDQHRESQKILASKQKFLDDPETSVIYCGLLSKISTYLLASLAVNSGLVRPETTTVGTMGMGIHLAGSLVPVAGGFLQALGGAIQLADWYEEKTKGERIARVLLTNTNAEALADCVVRGVCRSYEEAIKKLSDAGKKQFIDDVFNKVIQILYYEELMPITAGASIESIALQIVQKLGQDVEKSLGAKSKETLRSWFDCPATLKVKEGIPPLTTESILKSPAAKKEEKIAELKMEQKPERNFVGMPSLEAINKRLDQLERDMGAFFGNASATAPVIPEKEFFVIRDQINRLNDELKCLKNEVNLNVQRSEHALHEKINQLDEQIKSFKQQQISLRASVLSQTPLRRSPMVSSTRAHYATKITPISAYRTPISRSSHNKKLGIFSNTRSRRRKTFSLYPNRSPENKENIGSISFFSATTPTRLDTIDTIREQWKELQGKLAEFFKQVVSFRQFYSEFNKDYYPLFKNNVLWDNNPQDSIYEKFMLELNKLLSIEENEKPWQYLEAIKNCILKMDVNDHSAESDVSAVSEKMQDLQTVLNELVIQEYSFLKYMGQLVVMMNMYEKILEKKNEYLKNNPNTKQIFKNTSKFRARIDYVGIFDFALIKPVQRYSHITLLIKDLLKLMSKQYETLGQMDKVYVEKAEQLKQLKNEFERLFQEWQKNQGSEDIFGRLQQNETYKNLSKIQHEQLLEEQEIEESEEESSKEESKEEVTEDLDPSPPGISY